MESLAIILGFSEDKVLEDWEGKKTVCVYIYMFHLFFKKGKRDTLITKD